MLRTITQMQKATWAGGLFVIEVFRIELNCADVSADHKIRPIRKFRRIRGSDNQPHAAQLRNVVGKLVAGGTDEHEVLGDIPLLRQLLNERGPEMAFHGD
jgi:hypothetical protein